MHLFLLLCVIPVFLVESHAASSSSSCSAAIPSTTDYSVTDYAAIESIRQAKAPKMKAVLFQKPGGPEELYIGETSVPDLKSGEVLIRVHAFSLNRADASQRKGAYPPPAGASQILGLDAAGEVISIGPDASKSWLGKRVMALLAGGGYAEQVAAHEGSLILIPDTMSYVEAAAIPEAWLTAYQISHFVGKMAPDEHVLIHGGASGVGTAAIQLARLIGAQPFVTVGSAEKAAFCKALGAVHAINYKTTSFSDSIRAYTAEHKIPEQGVNLILDCVGGSHAISNVDIASMDGRWVLFGQMGGSTVDAFPLGRILGKRLQLLGTTLRTRSQAYKTVLVKDFTEKVMPAFAIGKCQVIIDKVVPWESIVEATRQMDNNENIGKIVLQIIPETSEQTHKHTYRQGTTIQ